MTSTRQKSGAPVKISAFSLAGARDGSWHRPRNALSWNVDGRHGYQSEWETELGDVN